jgi:membrane protein implicated in regulation of membrane protease activity
MPSVEVIATATIWSMFSCFLLFPRLGLPAVWHRTAMALLIAELLALGAWSYGGPGAPGAEAGRTAAAIDIPLLAVALIVFAAAYGVRAWRRQTVIYYRRDEDPRHRVAGQGRLRDRDRAG